MRRRGAFVLLCLYMEARVPATHPLRTIRTIVNEVLGVIYFEFEALYEGIGRQSVAPERLLRASLLQAFYSVRSECQLMEQMNYNLLFRWLLLSEAQASTSVPSTAKCALSDKKRVTLG